MRRLVVIALLLSLCGVACADELSQNRSVMKNILKVVASDIEKNFYDPNLKGLNWPRLVETARQKIDNAKSVNEMEAAIYELTEQIDDSHTFFIPPLGTSEAKYGFEAKPFGDDVRVYEITPKGAAEQAGLQLGDHIVSMQGTPLDRSNFERMFIYGRLIYMASPLVFEIERDGATKTIQITPKFIKRPIVLDSFSRYGDLWSLVIEAETEEMKYPFVYGMDNQVGYLKLRDFPAEGGDFLHGLAEKIEGAKALILDLRNCPGGTIESLVAFEGMFEDQEIELANTVSRKKTEPVKIKPQKPQMRVPIFVLMDSATASAAEIVAYHLHTSKKAVLIGDDSAGMVTGAKTFEGNVGGGAIINFATNVAVARMVFPGGVELEGKSLKPDVRCLPTQKEMRGKIDACRNKAMELAVSAINKKFASAEPAKP